MASAAVPPPHAQREILPVERCTPSFFLFFWLRPFSGIKSFSTTSSVPLRRPCPDFLALILVFLLFFSLRCWLRPFSGIKSYSTTSSVPLRRPCRLPRPHPRLPLLLL